MTTTHAQRNHATKSASAYITAYASYLNILRDIEQWPAQLGRVLNRKPRVACKSNKYIRTVFVPVDARKHTHAAARCDCLQNHNQQGGSPGRTVGVEKLGEFWGSKQ